jgi:hypothetical protein
MEHIMLTAQIADRQNTNFQVDNTKMLNSLMNPNGTDFYFAFTFSLR